MILTNKKIKVDNWLKLTLIILDISNNKDRKSIIILDTSIIAPSTSYSLLPLFSRGLLQLS